jgi:hypothetical protein
MAEPTSSTVVDSSNNETPVNKSEINVQTTHRPGEAAIKQQ